MANIDMQQASLDSCPTSSPLNPYFKKDFESYPAWLKAQINIQFLHLSSDFSSPECDVNIRIGQM